MSTLYYTQTTQCRLHVLLRCAGGLQEPAVVPRFLQALTAAGAAPERVPAYDTRPGLVGPAACVAEATLLVQGYFDAIAFSSTAEVRRGCISMHRQAHGTGVFKVHLN
jgi:hypothetical protein